MPCDMTSCDCEDQIVRTESQQTESERTEPQPVDADAETTEPAVFDARPRTRITGKSPGRGDQRPRDDRGAQTPREVEMPLHCRMCGDVIGVYEPLVMCEDSQSRVTSCAAEPGLLAMEGVYYHRACFLEPDGSPISS